MTMYTVNHYDPQAMAGKVDPKMQGWVAIEADSPAEAAEEYLLAWWESDPADFPKDGCPVWVRVPGAPGGPMEGEALMIIRFDVVVDWEPSFTAGLGAEVTIDA